MLRGAEDLKKVCKRRIGDEHHVSADGNFTWMEVECLGACVNAPMVQIDADYYEDLTVESFEKILDAFAAGKTPEAGPQIDRQLSAPVGGPTTLANGQRRSTGPGRPPLTDTEAKKPGAAANVREAGVPKPPIGDQSGPGRS
jgi:NADH-quinone oxidoreductase subunit E